MGINTAAGPLIGKVLYFIELPTINGRPAANFQLRQLKTMDITDNESGEVITGGAGTIGKTFAAGGKTLAGESHRQGGVPNEVDWIGLKTAGPGETPIDFVISMQDVGGTRYSLPRCSVTKVDIKGANDGNQTMTFEVISDAKITQIQPAVA
jgi:hypothetical protein